MIRRCALLAGMGGAALAGEAWAAGAWRARMAATETRLAFRSHLDSCRRGPTEYAMAGRGEPLMMIHGTGDGFGRGLLFAHLQRETFQVIAPSRFGHLRSGFPRDPRPRPGPTFWPEGGPIRLGHDADVAGEIAAYVGTADP